jgi:hypothetical protein
MTTSRSADGWLRRIRQIEEQLEVEQHGEDRLASIYREMGTREHLAATIDLLIELGQLFGDSMPQAQEVFAEEEVTEEEIAVAQAEMQLQQERANSGDPKLILAWLMESLKEEEEDARRERQG